MGAYAGSAVYVFTNDVSSWVEQEKLTASDGPGDRFGYSVSIDGDDVVVGAYVDDGDGNASGSVYLFE